MIKLSPSVLSADFSCLGSEMKALRKSSDMVLDVHLMIDTPIKYVERFCDAGADILTIHVEADTEENTRKALEMIRAKGVKPAVCIKPKTPAEAILPFLDLCELVLVMTVEPGFGGQSFMEDMMPKLRQVRALIDEKKPGCELEVDGGVNQKTAEICKANGANVLVAGSSVLGKPSVREAAQAVLAAAKQSPAKSL